MSERTGSVRGTLPSVSRPYLSFWESVTDGDMMGAAVDDGGCVEIGLILVGF